MADYPLIVLTELRSVLYALIVNSCVISNILQNPKEVKVVNVIVHILFLIDFLILTYKYIKKKVLFSTEIFIYAKGNIALAGYSSFWAIYGL